MPVSLRDLLPNVKQFRPDVSDGQIMFFIKDAARKVAAYSQIFRDTLVLPAITRSEIALQTGNMSRVHSAKIYDQVPDGLTFQGTWNPRTNTPFVGQVPKFLGGQEGSFLGPNIPAGMNPTPAYPTITFMDDETILMSGVATGTTNSNGVTPFFIFNLRTESWAGPFNVGGYRFTGAYGTGSFGNNGRSMIPLGDGRVLILGGIRQLLPSGIAAIEPPTEWEHKSFVISKDGTIKNGPDLPASSRWVGFPQWCKMPNGKIYLYGGMSADSTNTSVTNIMYEVNPAGPSITALGGAASMAQLNHRATGCVLIPIDDSRIFISNGCQVGNVGQQPNALIYNIVSQAFTKVALGRLNRWPTTWTNFSGQSDAAFCKLPGGRIGVWGYAQNAPDNVALSRSARLIEAYDPDTNTWSDYLEVPCPLGTDYSPSNVYAQMFTLQNGTVLAVGYDGGSGAVPHAVTILTDKSFSAYALPTPGITQNFLRDVTGTVSGGTVLLAGASASAPTTTGLRRTTVIINTLAARLPAGWYDVSESYPFFVGGSDNWTRNDIAYSYDGLTFTQVKWNTAKSLRPVNTPTLDATRGDAEAQIGVPTAYAIDGSAITLYPTPNAGSEWPVRFDISFVPSTLDDINDDGVYDIPPEVEEVIIDGALSRVYDIPGENKSSQLATFHRAAFKRGEGNLKAVSMFGYSGTPQYITGNFGASNGFSVTW